MNRFRRISAAARQRLVFDLRMPAGPCSRLAVSRRCPDVASSPARRRNAVATIPSVFNSRLMQPLFTELANLLQNTRRATERLGTARWRPAPTLRPQRRHNHSDAAATSESGAATVVPRIGAIGEARALRSRHPACSWMHFPVAESVLVSCRNGQ